MYHKLVVVLVGILLVGSCKKRDFGAQKSSLNSAPLVMSTNSADAYSILEREKERFANAHYRTFDDHNRTLFQLEEMIDAKLVDRDQKWTIMHFDNHSDLYRSDVHLTGARPDIGNYINTMIYKGYVDKVYWIVPDDKLSSDANEIGTEVGCKTIKSKRKFFFERPTFEDIQFRDGPRDQLICVQSSGRFIYKGANDGCPAGTRVVPFYKRTMNDLMQDDPSLIPDESELKTFRATEDLAAELQKENVIIDIDLDYFDTTGQYANEFLRGLVRDPQCYYTHFSKEVLFTEFRRFAELITTKLDLRPQYVTASRSPGYMKKNVHEILRFAKCLGSKVGLSKKSTPIADGRLLQYTDVLSETPCKM